MLIPRFSLRQLLAVTTASAVFCYLLGMAARGHEWAIAISIAISSVLLAFVGYAIVFAAAWLMTPMAGLSARRKVAASPFADAVSPPQFIPPPEDQE